MAGVDDIDGDVEGGSDDESTSDTGPNGANPARKRRRGSCGGRNRNRSNRPTSGVDGEAVDDEDDDEDSDEGPDDRVEALSTDVEGGVDRPVVARPLCARPVARRPRRSESNPPIPTRCPTPRTRARCTTPKWPSGCSYASPRSATADRRRRRPQGAADDVAAPAKPAAETATAKEQAPSPLGRQGPRFEQAGAGRHRSW